MSKVYIRRQKKDGLYIFDNTQGIRYSTQDKEESFFLSPLLESEKQTGKNCIFLYFSSGGCRKLGEYESKERCIEIIDEIQGVCGQYLYAPGNTGFLIGSEATPPMAAVIPRLYQMPEK